MTEQERDIRDELSTAVFRLYCEVGPERTLEVLQAEVANIRLGQRAAAEVRHAKE